MPLIQNKLIHGCAHITGGGLQDNLSRIIPKNLCVNIFLDKIKVKPIFKWIKNIGVSDKEMIKTFNCGVGFCLITKKKNLKKIKKFFQKKFLPYEIGYITKDKKKLNLFNRVKW